jgi:hypothetical protein
LLSDFFLSHDFIFPSPIDNDGYLLGFHFGRPPGLAVGILRVFYLDLPQFTILVFAVPADSAIDFHAVLLEIYLVGPAAGSKRG